MYDSPIKIIQDQIEMDMENEVMKAVLRCNIDVNKADLLKALKFDREQYETGFFDCKEIYKRKFKNVVMRLEEMTYKPTELVYDVPLVNSIIGIIKEEGGIE